MFHEQRNDGPAESSQAQPFQAAPGTSAGVRFPVVNPFLRPQPRELWGFWPTVILGLVYLIFSHTVVPFIYWAAPLEWIGEAAGFHAWDYQDPDGLYQNIATTIMVAACLPVIVFMTRVQRFPLREYCHLDRLRLKPVLLCLVLMVGLAWATHEFFRLAGLFKGGSHGYSYHMYVTSGWPVLEFVCSVLMAPFIEEVFWRGFIFKGICESKAGPLAAIAITSLFWAAQHTQYSLAGRGDIFIMGLFLATVRYLTRSTTLTIFLHGAYNSYIFVSILMLVEFGIKLP